MRKNKAFEWMKESEMAFQQLKEYLGLPPLLIVPNIGTKTRYLRIENLAYALMISARKLRHYFEAHPNVVLTDQSLK